LIFNIIRIGHYPSENTVVENYLSWLSIAWFLLEIVTMLTNEKRRALHDMIAGSVVIKEEFWKNR
jgi:uncharacterized RDD family membrane protein YckC